MSRKLFLETGHTFTDEDKENCISTVKRILELAYTARMHGILALEMQIFEEEDFLLKTGISLVTDGTEPEIVKNILENFIVSNKYSGCELLRALIVLEGVCNIQQGENPRIIAMRLASMLGGKYVSCFENELVESCGATKELYTHLANKFLDKKALKESARFEAEISSLDFRSIQLVLRHVENDELSRAMMGCRFSTIKLITDNLSIRTAIIILEEMELIKPVKSEILKAQAEILEVINKLATSGEIIISDINRKISFIAFDAGTGGKPDLQ